MSDGSTPDPGNHPGRPFSPPLLTVAGSALACTAVLVGWIYFGPWLGLWLILLAGLAAACPVLGLGVLFICVSIDVPRPIFSHLVVSFSELESAVFAAAWVAGRSRAGSFPIRDWRLLSWSCPFLAAMLLSGLATSSAWRAVPNTVRFAEMFVVALIAVNVLGETQRRAVKFRWFLLGSIFLYTTLGLVQFPSVRWGRIYSAFENPNQFAGYLALLMPFFLVLFLTTKGRQRIIWGYTILLVLLSSVATLSRAGFVAGFCSLVFVLVSFWLFQRRGGTSPRKFLLSDRSLLPHLLILLTLVAALGLVPTVRRTMQVSFYNLAARSKGGLLGSFAEARLPYFAVGWAIWRDHPWLGSGPGNYRRALAAHRDLVRSYRGKLRSYRFFSRAIKLHVHNLYLQLAVDFGILGLVCFLYFLYRLCDWLMSRSRYTPVALAGLGMLVSFLLHNMLDVTYPSLGLEIGLLIGLAGTSDRL